jgi:hypothetical protein
MLSARRAAAIAIFIMVSLPEFDCLGVSIWYREQRSKPKGAGRLFPLRVFQHNPRPT